MTDELETQEEEIVLPRPGDFVQEEPEEEAPEAQEAVEEPKQEKPRGWDKVDFDQLPDELRQPFEDRFKRIYGQMKESSALVEQTISDNRKLHEKVQQMEASQNAAKREQELATLQEQVAEAYAQGDYQRGAELTAFMAKKQAEGLLPEMPLRPEPATPPVNQYDAVVQAWVQERNPDGSVKRPWTMEGHPEKQKAIHLANQVSVEKPHLSVFEQLAEVDRLMAGQEAPTAPKPTTAAVMSSGDRRPKPATEANLTAAQKAVAQRMFPSLKASDAHKEYAKGLS